MNKMAPAKTQAQTDDFLRQRGYRTGAAVAPVIVRCYGMWLGSEAIAAAQLASLKAAWRAEWAAERTATQGK